MKKKVDFSIKYGISLPNFPESDEKVYPHLQFHFCLKLISQRSYNKHYVINTNVVMKGQCFHITQRENRVILKFFFQFISRDQLTGCQHNGFH